MNYWVLGWESIAEYTADLTPVDGDLTELSLEDNSVDIGNESIRRRHVMTAGRKVVVDNLPTQVSCDGKVETVADLAIVHGDFTASEALKNLIDQEAPGDVQLEPFELVQSGQVVGKRYWFIPNVRLHAMDREKSKPGFSAIGYYDFRGSWENKQIVFDANVTSGTPIFASAEYPGIIFVSDAMVEAMERSGLTGARFKWNFPAV